MLGIRSEVKSPHGGSDFGGWRKEEWTLDMGRAKKRVINSSSLLLPTRRRRKRRDFPISPTASDPIRTEISLSLGGGPAELGVGKNYNAWGGQPEFDHEIMITI